MNQLVQNFGRNLRFQPSAIAKPESEAEVLQLLKQQRGQTVRVVGSRHAWSDAIQTDGLLINLEKLNRVWVSPDRSTAVVGAGCQIKDALQQLKEHGLTLPSVGLIDEQTIAGATATGTHGSGKHSLSHYVRRVRIAHYDSKTDEPVITEIDSGTELLAARCSLGLMGVVTEVEMEVRPDYRIVEHSDRYDSLESVIAMEADAPLQQFFLMPWCWHWFGQHRAETDRPRSRFAKLYRIYWHIGLDWGLHLIILLMAKILRARFVIRWFYRFLMPLLVLRNLRVTDDAHQMLTMDHELFRHIEIEAFVPRSKLKAALHHVRSTITSFGGFESDVTVPKELVGSYCHHYPICIRRVIVDQTLISMTSPAIQGGDEDWYAISLISYHWPNQRTGFIQFAQFIASSMQQNFNARIHWGKVNPLGRDQNEAIYPRMDEFRTIVDRFDKDRRFANRWLRDVLLKRRD